jgi:hypothetical protein
MLDIKHMSWDELEELQRVVHLEKEKRKEKRFVELCDTVCTALNALKKEYPFVEFSQEIECPDCDCCIDVNLFDHCDTFSANMFSMG